MGDDVVIAAEDAVGEPVVAQELPDVLDRVELRRARRQRQEGDVVWYDELAREVPAGLVEDEDGVGARRDGGADLAEMRLHRRRVAVGHHEAGALALFRADCAEDVGPLGALIVGRPRPGAAPSPAAGDLVLLPDPRLVLEPELYGCVGRETRPDRPDRIREAFLNWSAASGSCA